VKNFAAIAFLAAAAALCQADYQSASAVWKDWTIDLQSHPLGLRNHYPISNLFDGDAATAWVFEHPTKTKEPDMPPGPVKSPYQITLTPNDPVVIDSIQLMNGYNKSRATFGRNDRALHVEVWARDENAPEGERVIASSWLKDTMGWHMLRIPEKKYDSLTIVFSGIRKGKDSDLALSELCFISRGKQVPWHLPKVAMMTHGSECG
jgi:hypothetical protein